MRVAAVEPAKVAMEPAAVAAATATADEMQQGRGVIGRHGGHARGREGHYHRRGGQNSN
jgi:hypothetical protein